MTRLMRGGGSVSILYVDASAIGPDEDVVVARDVPRDRRDIMPARGDDDDGGRSMTVVVALVAIGIHVGVTVVAVVLADAVGTSGEGEQQRRNEGREGDETFHKYLLRRRLSRTRGREQAPFRAWK